MHRIQRKPSSETLTSVGMDSTLDSRMSSAEVPQMELLKVNYVHQCKEAFMTKTGSVPQYNFMDFKKTPSPSYNGNAPAHKNVNRISINRQEAPNKPLPPPPPTVESWQFLQNSKRTTNSPPKLIKTPAVSAASLASSDTNECSSKCCHALYDAANESDHSTNEDGVKSNSWNYRNKMSTCDIRRDMARAGIKSRAERIARIEHTECEHSNSKQDKATEKIERNSDSNVNPKEAVAKINKMFEAQKQLKNIPPQPKRPAPVPHKEPNRRLKPTNQQFTEQSQTRSSVSVNSAYTECSECSQECSDNCSVLSQETVQYRRNEPKESRAVSRIPKPIPITDKQTSKVLVPKPPTNKPTERTKTQENIQKSKSIEHLKDLETEKSSLVIDEQLLRNTRISVGNYQKAKVERIHIRKKRQPLLIINQLNDLERHKPEENSRKSTCGYKNCNFDNCPMSVVEHERSLKPYEQEDCNKLKRLSLESNSDSGVSSSHDFKEEKKRISCTQLKNLDKCSDVKNKQQQATSNKSEHFPEYAFNKMKLPKEIADSKTISSAQIKIVQQGTFNSHYNTADLNDVSNFNKKNLTKATTNEALNNTASLTKQCNIENEQRLKIKNNLRLNTSTTHIKIDDDWVKEETVESQDDYIECDSLMVAEKPLRKPINCNDNAVKIFVRSSQQTQDLCRSSCTSANSFVSQTSICTQNSTSVGSLTSSASSSSTSDSSSGCGGSSNADNQSLCDSERECCCQLSTTAGMFFNRPCSALSQEHPRLCAGSPVSSTDAISDISSCVTCSTNPSTVITTLALQNSPPCCSGGENGIFWNNAYIPADAQDDSNLPPCCCSVSSCDEDNCSYYETRETHTQNSDKENSTLEEKINRLKSSINDKANKLSYQPQLTKTEELQMRHLSYQSERSQQAGKRNTRNSSAEEILIRNHLLRKVSL